jgi:hypothetical protein
MGSRSMLAAAGSARLDTVAANIHGMTLTPPSASQVAVDPMCSSDLGAPMQQQPQLKLHDQPTKQLTASNTGI